MIALAEQDGAERRDKLTAAAEARIGGLRGGEAALCAFLENATA